MINLSPKPKLAGRVGLLAGNGGVSGGAKRAVIGTRNVPGAATLAGQPNLQPVNVRVAHSNVATGADLGDSLAAVSSLTNAAGAAASQLASFSSTIQSQAAAAVAAAPGAVNQVRFTPPTTTPPSAGGLSAAQAGQSAPAHPAFPGAAGARSGGFLAALKPGGGLQTVAAWATVIVAVVFLWRAIRGAT